MVEKDNKNISVKRQGELLSINRTSLYYKPVGIPDEEIALIKLYYKRRHIT
ncbi:hypothetical protein [Lutispora sp.]|uniref:hypothetical protein n=1 Tax=Lutispora sp. TaxID=2828727 RepID=UPI002B1E9333|nr:hypothetical protein [Lutispora sp.]